MRVLHIKFTIHLTKERKGSDDKKINGDNGHTVGYPLFKALKIANGMPKVGDFLMEVFPNFRNSCISEAVIDTYRRTCSKMFYKETIQKNSTKFKGKHLSWSLSLSK